MSSLSPSAAAVVAPREGDDPRSAPTADAVRRHRPPRWCLPGGAERPARPVGSLCAGTPGQMMALVEKHKAGATVSRSAFAEAVKLAVENGAKQEL